ncbi:MAG: hypothetical protein ACYCXG_11770 [Acidiferrobacter sp.]
MSNIGNFFRHPAESIGGVFKHPGRDLSSALRALPPPVKDIVDPVRLIGGGLGEVLNHPGQTRVGQFAAHNPLLLGAVALDVLTYGGFSGEVAALAGGASTYVNAAAAGTYASGAVHGLPGLRNEFSTGPTRSDYITGAEFAAAEGIGAYVDSSGGAMARLGSGFAALRTASALGLTIFPAPTLGPNATAAQISNAQLQADITGQAIQGSNGGPSSGGGPTAAAGGTAATAGGGIPITTVAVFAVAALLISKAGAA